MKLYYHPLSPYCRKVLVAAYEKNIDFEPEIVDIFDAAAKKKYTDEVHPLGKVPFLALENGWMIPESSIIIEYLDTHFDSGPKLIPNDKDKARQSRFFDRVGDLYMIEPAGALLMQKASTPASRRDKELIERSNKLINLALKLNEEHMGRSKYILGDQFSFADISLSSGINSVTALGITLSDYPETMKWLDRVNQRDSWTRVRAESEPYMGTLI